MQTCLNSHLQYSQRGTFIWTPITAIYLNVFAEKDHRNRCFLPIFRVVTGVQLPTAVNTARRGVRTPRIPMAGHGGPWWLIAYFKQFTCTLYRRWKTIDRDDILTFGLRETRGSWPPGSTGVQSVFDRAWIILTTGGRGFMKVPRWLYCNKNIIIIVRQTIQTKLYRKRIKLGVQLI